ncbi:ribosome small subunit-dependent GTPase A [Veillonella sp. AS16]|uniref:ribosome small subunit-dependent GTPase A n=1 Tax=Veillonella sp. AS16 TaxID=936589 RepID=UPI0003E2A3CC|nr:ribosome small subunit-dependent GTPase A [Veillonella sp. AS16]ETS93138.1 ribosome small subunit-dependent GTPase A [Veillonella sp. AS16]
MITGIVIKNMNGYFYVQDEEGTVHECKVRGRLKKGRYSLLVGDRVTISNDGFVESIHERHNSMIRPAVANIDQVVLVVAAHEPDINELLLNKMLVMIEHADIPIILCVNKCDLMDASTISLVDLYRSIGYDVIMTSTYAMTGIDELRHVLEHKVTAFAGPSGVGKSSLLNAVDSKFTFQTGEVSDKIKRGRHTTRHASLFSLNTDSFIMDTPGFSAIEFNDVSLERLTTLFPEFADYVEDCKFNPCYHEHEPICGIKEALASGLIHKGRYDAYMSIRRDIENQRKRF